MGNSPKQLHFPIKQVKNRTNEPNGKGLPLAPGYQL